MACATPWVSAIETRGSQPTMEPSGEKGGAAQNVSNSSSPLRLLSTVRLRRKRSPRRARNRLLEARESPSGHLGPQWPAVVRCDGRRVGCVVVQSGHWSKRLHGIDTGIAARKGGPTLPPTGWPGPSSSAASGTPYTSTGFPPCPSRAGAGSHAPPEPPLRYRLTTRDRERRRPGDGK